VSNNIFKARYAENHSFNIKKDTKSAKKSGLVFIRTPNQERAEIMYKVLNQQKKIK